MVKGRPFYWAPFRKLEFDEFESKYDKDEIIVRASVYGGTGLNSAYVRSSIQQRAPKIYEELEIMPEILDTNIGIEESLQDMPYGDGVYGGVAHRRIQAIIEQ